jgi:dihydroxyacid dehydratase/phosphogluconate dehydratase
MDAETLENAAGVIAASGRATSEAVHLPALAHECVITFDLFNVVEVFKRTSYTAHLKPSGRYLAKDLFEGGSVPLLMKSLRNHGFLRGNGMTVTGRSVAESVKIVAWNDEQDVVHPANSSDGNVIATDADKAALEVRRTDGLPRAPAFASGSIWKYVERLGPTGHGAVTHPGVAVEKSCYADI